TKLDREVARRLGAYRANYVRTRDPDRPGLPVWPRLDAGGRLMELGGAARSPRAHSTPIVPSSSGSTRGRGTR
ncbi:MAG: hypothetical protein ACM3PV_09535, partial [Betaproteobacteria bacterium]